jgi:hypothetical protein
MPLARAGSMNRTTRIKRVSDRRAAALVIYTEARDAFMKAHPWCQVPGCLRASRDPHHTCGRLDGNFLNRETWMAVCRPCHDWIHAHPSQARAKGWLK